MGIIIVLLSWVFVKIYKLMLVRNLAQGPINVRSMLLKYISKD